MPDEIKADVHLDLSGVICPLNWTMAKLALEELEDGQVLEVILDRGEPLRNVPRSAKAEGHRIVDVEPEGEEQYRLLIEKH